MSEEDRLGVGQAPETGAAYRREETGEGEAGRPGEDLGSTGGLDVWKHIAMPAAGVLVALLVFLFGTDVIGRMGEGGTLGDDGPIAAAGEPSQREPRLHATYSFKQAPFVHPKIINDLVGYLSDTGDQVVAINLLDSQESNRYFGEIAVTPQADPMEPSWPWVYSVDGEENADKRLGELWGRPWYAYRYVGSTQGGLDVLHVRYSGGGSGIFNRVVFTRTEMDRGVDYPLAREVESRTAAARPEVRDRELIRFVGKIPLGDRWVGTVEVVENDVVVRGRDLYERCGSGGVTTMEAVEMERFMDMDCKDVPAAEPPPARVYEAPRQTGVSPSAATAGGVPPRAPRAGNAGRQGDV